MSPASELPPGQVETRDFPRFGLWPYAARFPREIGRIPLLVRGEVEAEAEVGEELSQLPRVEQVADFHCVTTWTKRALVWSGFRFVDFYQRIVLPRARPLPGASFVVLRGQDGYRTNLPLEDLLAADVLLADRLEGRPLTVEHGAPLRLVAPAHYGYKNVKHLDRLELASEGNHDRPAGFRFMDHPRARVALEERGRGLPGWLLRRLYRPLIRPTVRRFARALSNRPPDGAAQ